jgi:hypothetical protein
MMSIVWSNAYFMETSATEIIDGLKYSDRGAFDFARTSDCGMTGVCK